MKWRKLGILRRNRRIVDRPTKTDLGVVPNDAAIQLRSIFCRNLIKDIGLFAQHAKTMSKAYRDIKQATILGGEYLSHPSGIRRGAATDIHRNVEDFASQNSYELSLILRMFLIMQASENSSKRMRIVVLHEGIVDPISREVRSLIALHESATLIFESLSFNQDQIRDVQSQKLEGHNSQSHRTLCRGSVPDQ